MSSIANSLLWLDFWQENRAPHLRFPFNNSSLSTWPAVASLRVDEPFHWHMRSAWGHLSAALQTCAPFSLSHEDVVTIWRDIQLLTAAGLFVLLHLSFLLTLILSVWLSKRKARGIHIPKAWGQREKGSFYHMPAGSRTDFDIWAPERSSPDRGIRPSSPHNLTSAVCEDTWSSVTTLYPAGYFWTAKQGLAKFDVVWLKQINKHTSFWIITRHICIKKPWLLC